MFGPNTYFKNKVNINYSHRDIQFFEYYEKVQKKFKEVFHLENYDIMFIPGSATVGIESLMYSLQVPLNIIGVEGTFKFRWTDMYRNYYRRLTPNQKSKDAINLYCNYETSVSESFYSDEDCFIDATSGFPYLDFPKNCRGFITSLNKQIGSYIGLAVVGIRKDSWNLFKNDSEMSYLNLARYKTYADQNQGPATFPTFILEHLLRVLNNFNIDKLRKKIDDNSKIILKYVDEDALIGNKIGPCITFKKDYIPEEICKKYDLYGYWAHREHIQMFTYNGSKKQYKKVMKEIYKYRHKKEI